MSIVSTATLLTALLLSATGAPTASDAPRPDAAPASQASPAAQATPAELSDRHRRWLEEEVVHIIGDYEREAFLGLTDDKARQLFIDAFWKIRDPTPSTRPPDEVSTHR